MPELPEVETYVRELGPRLVGRRIHGAQVFWPRTIAEPAVAQFCTQIAGLRFAGYGRRGKYMLLGLHESAPAPATEPYPWTLIVHLRMTGKLALVPRDFTPDKYTHVVIDLDPDTDPVTNPVTNIGGPHSDNTHPADRLVFIDARKFGRIWLTPNPAAVLTKLGPEPLSADFTPQCLGRQLDKRRSTVKALLLDQAVVAGVGNIYADEALFHAGIHPTRPGASLTQLECERLHAAVCRVLEAGIRRQGSSLGGSALQNYVRPSGEQGGFQEEHRVFRRTGQKCYACGATIERIVIAQRSTHFCPTCQPA